MKVDLTDKQIKDIWKQITPNQVLDLLELTPNDSLDIICRFIYLNAHQGWQKKKIQETLDATPTEIELFPEDNTP